jgi:hypothetical protein
MTKDWIVSPYFPQLTVPLLLFLILAIIGIILICIALLRKPFSHIQKTAKPKFDHIEAWFFYPKRYRWDRHERDPNKIVPRQKLALVKDLKKAYIIGDYALNLVKTGKIKSWFSEDEQDNLDDWCNKKGYIPTHDEATEDKLLEPFFEAEIKDKKQEYHREELVLFRMHFRGPLEHGFFDNEILHCEGQKFPRGRFQRKNIRDWSWPFETLSIRAKWRRWWFAEWIPIFRGKLNGYVNVEFEWCWAVPLNAPLGQYRIFMRVYKGVLPEVIREKEEIINVVS